ncbi:MAG: hypothetical protein GEV11_25565, partial [Streptosporangiales bacterium]|nr:hypothetical protein [Streptosporangiales bacterium]
MDAEYARNAERYAFFRWCQSAFVKLRVVPPGHGIVHQVNLEHLSPVIRGDGVLDTVVGTDSHTTMIGALGRAEAHVRAVEAHARERGLWVDPGTELDFPELVEIDLAEVEPAVAGPYRPQDRLPLTRVAAGPAASSPASPRAGVPGSVPGAVPDGA